MKRILVYAALCMTLAAAAPALAKDYQSSFGFAASIPDNWLVMTKQEIKSNPALADASTAKLGSINPDLVQKLKAKVESGAVEMLFDRATSDETFADNVNVMVRKGQIPTSPDALAQSCKAFSAGLAKYAGRTLAVSHCEAREVGTAKSIYLEYEGVVAGTVTMQYQIQRPNGELLQVTATCKQSSLDKVRPDFEGIVKSIRFTQAS